MLIWPDRRLMASPRCRRYRIVNDRLHDGRGGKYCLVDTWFEQPQADLLQIVHALRRRPHFRAALIAGKSRPIKMPMMAMTTSNSTNVNPDVVSCLFTSSQACRSAAGRSQDPAKDKLCAFDSVIQYERGNCSADLLVYARKRLGLCIISAFAGIIRATIWKRKDGTTAIGVRPAKQQKYFSQGEASFGSRNC